MKVVVGPCFQFDTMAEPHPVLPNATLWNGPLIWLLAASLRMAKIPQSVLNITLMEQSFSYNPTTAALKRLKSGEADVSLAVMGFSAQATANSMFYPLDSSYVTIISKKIMPTVAGDFLLRIFDLYILVLLLLVILTSSLSFTCIQLASGAPSIEWSSDFFTCLGMALRQGPRLSHYHHLASKILILSFDVSMSFLTYAFCVLIISVIVMPTRPEQVNSFADLLRLYPDHSIVIPMHFGADRLLAKLQVGQHVLDKIIPINLMAGEEGYLEVLQRLFEREDAVLVSTRHNFGYFSSVADAADAPYHLSGPIGNRQYYSLGMSRRMTEQMHRLKNAIAYAKD